MPRYVVPSATLVNPIDVPNRGPASYLAMGTGWPGSKLVWDSDLGIIEVQFAKDGPITCIPVQNVRCFTRGVVAASPKDSK